MSKYQNEWVETEIGEVIYDIGDGGTPNRNKSENFGGSIPWVVVQDIKWKITNTKEKISDLGLKSSSAKLWSRGTVIISTGGTIGKVGIAKTPLCTKQGIHGIVCNEKYILPEYLGYYLISKKNKLNALSQGSTIKEVRAKILCSIKIKLPSINEQKKIVEILSGIDELIIKKRDLNKKNNLLLKAFIEDLMKGDENWDRVFLSEILLFKNGLNTSKENFGVGTPFVSYKNVYAGGLIKVEDLTECVSLTSSEEDRFCLKRGDILFTRTSETPDEIGFNAVYNTSAPAVFNGFCIRGRPLNDLLLIPEFSSFCFRSDVVLSQMRSLCKYTTRAGISSESLGKVQIMLPPINVQEKIANSLSSLKQLIRAVDQSIHSLENLKYSISEDLLSGRKRVNI